ncbi:flagellar export protein FliJ [Marinomonas sp. 15G1-11]|uniref:Flagellar FliJ protein n=1 Tax=Marinomonas phaeophyticola TaxID=3004091 RepID=A0ABT4JY26_9GAMM|nr:flagellar export protein FliJ [Marinomonas sp. 15G1-11]MCZ2723292.1 flagellar export protein FliJ [Marinomonas sp. 15G1-11]
MQQAQVESEKEKLTQLEEYAEQYRSEKNLIGLNAFLSTNYQHFVDRLGQAIVQQKQQIARVEQQSNFVRHQWIKARGKTESMDWLKKKHLTSEELVESKKEQAQSDEFAMQRFLILKNT